MTETDVASERSFVFTCPEIMDITVSINGFVRHSAEAVAAISMKFAARISALLCPGRFRKARTVPGGSITSAQAEKQQIELAVLKCHISFSTWLLATPDVGAAASAALRNRGLTSDSAPADGKPS